MNFKSNFVSSTPSQHHYWFWWSGVSWTYAVTEWRSRATMHCIKYDFEHRPMYAYIYLIKQHTGVKFCGNVSIRHM